MDEAKRRAINEDLFSRYREESRLYLLGREHPGPESADPLQETRAALLSLARCGIQIKQTLMSPLPLPWWRRPGRWLFTQILLWDTWNTVVEEIDKMELVDPVWAQAMGREFLDQWARAGDQPPSQTLPYYP
jgi:hypothetical protein